jgi:phosphoribosylcarboxyaminoimidazole (NCAIR) mutase
LYSDSGGYPVAGMGINRYLNSALYASQIAGLFVPEIRKKVESYRTDLASSVREKDNRFMAKGIKEFLK